MHSYIFQLRSTCAPWENSKRQALHLKQSDLYVIVYIREILEQIFLSHFLHYNLLSLVVKATAVALGVCDSMCLVSVISFRSKPAACGLTFTHNISSRLLSPHLF